MTATILLVGLAGFLLGGAIALFRQRKPFLLPAGLVALAGLSLWAGLTLNRSA